MTPNFNAVIKCYNIGSLVLENSARAAGRSEDKIELEDD
jgi:hypothetical protein